MDFDCPRCDKPTAETFYGPCRPCRRDLRATMWNEPRDIDVTPYEPKVHVTANAVALKDD